MISIDLFFPVTLYGVTVVIKIAALFAGRIILTTQYLRKIIFLHFLHKILVIHQFHEVSELTITRTRMVYCMY